MKILGLRILEPEFITRFANESYLFRLQIFRCKLFSILFHIFSDSDDVCLHDHPWSFVSIVLWGGYYETDIHGNKTWYPPFSILRREPNWMHRVELKKDKYGKNIKAASLIFTSHKKRSWGFLTKFGWLHWSKYNYARHCEGE